LKNLKTKLQNYINIRNLLLIIICIIILFVYETSSQIRKPITSIKKIDNNITLKERKEIKKNNIKIKAISEYIQVKNNEVSREEAHSYAVSILNAANRFNKVDPAVLTGLIESESTFKKNVVHRAGSAVRLGVMGVTGIASKIWTKELKQQGIINSASDLNNPHKAIIAGGYILNKYSQHQSLLAALTDYKGNCALGRRQAQDVLRKAQAVRGYEQRILKEYYKS